MRETNEPPRVPMKARAGALSMDDIAASIGMPNVKTGRRFSLDIAEDALARMGSQAVPWIVEEVAYFPLRSHA